MLLLLGRVCKLSATYNILGSAPLDRSISAVCRHALARARCVPSSQMVARPSFFARPVVTSSARQVSRPTRHPSGCARRHRQTGTEPAFATFAVANQEALAARSRPRVGIDPSPKRCPVSRGYAARHATERQLWARSYWPAPTNDAFGVHRGIAL